MKAETKKWLWSHERGRAELLVLIAYVVCAVVVGIFHESWFDEAQAWNIAKSASYHDIIFKVCHYEGHPPLWYLLLSPFAKLGAPFEITIKALNISICTGAIALILYKSPFPKIIRLILPFTFYLNYQTVVNCRPYSLMLLALVLAAMFYKGRNERPWRYILSLMLLCGAHAFGILLAGGLCIVWACEILAAAVREKKLGSLWRDKRCHALFAILVLAVILALLIWPADDVYYQGQSGVLDNLNNVYMYLIVPVDSLFGVYTEVDTFKQTTSGFITSLIGGVLVLAVLFAVTKKNKKLAVFAVPYFTFLTFGIFKYLAWNHLGVSTFFILFTVWIILDDNPQLPGIFLYIRKKTESKLTVLFAKGVSCVMLLIPVAWTLYSSVLEIALPYGLRDIANYIADEGLDEHSFMMQWETKYDEKPDQIAPEDIDKYYNRENRTDYILRQGAGSTFAAYFGKNIFYNFNNGSQDMLYMQYRQSTDEEREQAFALWREQGYPEYMFNKCALDSVFPELKYSDIENMYDIIETFEMNYIYKFSNKTFYLMIFKLKDEYVGKGKPQ